MNLTKSIMITFNKNKNYLLLVIGTVAISFSPLVVKLVAMGPTASAFYRTLYAGIFLSIISLVRFKSEIKGIDLKWLKPILIGGFFLGIDFVLWHKTIIYIGAGPATFLGNSQVIFVSIFAAVIFREKIHKSFPFILPLIFFGLYLLTPSDGILITKPAGYFMGILVGIAYSVLIIALRYAKMLSPKYPEILSLSIIFFSASFTILIYALFFEKTNLIVWDLKSHILLMFIALFAQTFGWILIKSNITLIPAHRGSLILLIQPILATVWAYLLFSEMVGPVQIAGITIALGGIYIYQFKCGAEK